MAFALLNSSKTETYELFFKKIKDMKFCKFDTMTSDFEIAISNAAKKIFPKVAVQGCYYHYRNNLLNMISKIQNRFKKTISAWIVNLLSILPFLNKPTCFIEFCINDIWSKNENLYESSDFKILMYVYSTYIVRLKGMFVNLNPGNRIRTNNTCEGRNSVLAKNLPFKPSISDLIDFVGYRFKQDAVKLFAKQSGPNEFDRLILILHELSFKNFKSILQFCKEVKSFNFGNAKEHILVVEEILKDTSIVMQGSEDNSKLLIDKHASNYRNFQNVKKIKYEQFIQLYKNQKNAPSINNDKSRLTRETTFNSNFEEDITSELFSMSDDQNNELISIKSNLTKDQEGILNQKEIMKALISMNDRDFLKHGEKYISMIANNLKLIRTQRVINKIRKFEARRKSK